MIQKISALILSTMLSTLYSMNQQIMRLDDQCAYKVVRHIMDKKLSPDTLLLLPAACQEKIGQALVEQHSHLFWKMLARQATVTELIGHTHNVDAVAIYDDKCVTSGECIKIWDNVTGLCLQTIKKQPSPIANQIAVDWKNNICSLSFIYDYIYDYQWKWIEKYDLTTGQFIEEYEIKPPQVNLLHPNATKNIIYNFNSQALSRDNSIIIHAQRQSMLVQQPYRHYRKGSDCGCAAISNANNFFIMSDRNVVTMWDPIRYQPLSNVTRLYSFDCHDPKKKRKKFIESIAISPDNLSFIISYEKTAKIISIKNALNTLREKFSTHDLVKVIGQEIDYRTVRHTTKLPQKINHPFKGITYFLSKLLRRNQE